MFSNLTRRGFWTTLSQVLFHKMTESLVQAFHCQKIGCWLEHLAKVRTTTIRIILFSSLVSTDSFAGNAYIFSSSGQVMQLTGSGQELANFGGSCAVLASQAMVGAPNDREQEFDVIFTFVDLIRNYGLPQFKTTSGVSICSFKVEINGQILKFYPAPIKMNILDTALQSLPILQLWVLTEQLLVRLTCQF